MMKLRTVLRGGLFLCIALTQSALAQVQAASPTFSPAAGAYSSAQSVTISDTTAGAAIHYTTDGTAPTASSATYAGPISVPSTETLRAIAVAGGSTSAVATATYTISTAPPTFSPAAGAYGSAQSVTISDATPGAVIHYTTDGAAPTASSTTYTAPVSVTSTETLQAIAVDGASTSIAATAAYTISTTPPTFSPAAGAFDAAQSVTISDATPGAAIHYTTDGAAPTASSTTYTAPVSVTSTETLQAIAVVGGSTSAVAAAAYTISTAPPTFSPAAEQSVTISDATPGATIHYTTDGTAPTASSTTYTAPVSVTSTETLQAIAVAGGLTSAVATATYTIPPAQPTFSTVPAAPAAGPFTSALSVTISDTTAGAIIHYTTDGTAPTPKSATYAGPISVVSTETLRAIAVAGGSTSAVATATYTIAPDLQFTSELVTGSSTFSIQSMHAPETVYVYLFSAGYADGDKICQDSDRERGTLLTTTSSGSPNTTSNTIAIAISASSAPVGVTLSSPLVAGTLICLFGAATPAGAAPANPDNAFSNFKRVQYFAPGEDYGRFSVDLTGGVMISNQQQSSNSTTAAQYFDLGLFYTLARPDSEIRTHPNWLQVHGPGLATLMDVQLTTIPVASQTSTSTTTTSASTPTLSQSLNVLASQQSASVLMGVDFPFRVSFWYHKTNWITAAPLALGGFNTLLNPTTTAAASTNSNGGSSTTTSTFSTVYNFQAVGIRFGWDLYPKRTDEAPIEFSWVNLTLGRYSNLPSWLCTATPGATPPSSAKSFMTASNSNAPTTSCLVTPTPTSSSTGPYTVYASRKLVPRIDVAGELSLPSYPIVFGYDANLGQYSPQFYGDGIDSLNKPGNNVRFYFGIKLNITKALSKLGVPTS
jgi:hypothetical protein